MARNEREILKHTDAINSIRRIRTTNSGWNALIILAAIEFTDSDLRVGSTQIGFDFFSRFCFGSSNQSVSKLICFNLHGIFPSNVCIWKSKWNTTEWWIWEKKEVNRAQNRNQLRVFFSLQPLILITWFNRLCQPNCGVKFQYKQFD